MKNISSESFGHFVATGESVVQFSATWCGPCKVLTKTLENMNETSVPIGKVDIDQAQDIASQFGIRSVPTLIFFRDGKEVSRTMGAKPAPEIKQFLNENSNGDV